jgi:tetratricopeptide (TPR) repeat protein
MEVFEDLVKRFPNSPRFQARLGEIHESRAAIFERLGKLDDAAHEAEESRRILAEVVRTNPEVDEYQKHLVRSTMVLGVLKNKMGSHEDALAPLREACRAFERLLANHPDDLDLHKVYIVALNSLAVSVGSLGKDDEAVKALMRSGSLAMELLQRDPTNVFLRGEIMVNRMNLGIGLTATNRHAEAVSAYEESRVICRELFGSADWVHIESDDELAKVNLQMAYSLRELGRRQEAEAYVEKARQKIRTSPASLLRLACYEARGATLLARAGGDARVISALQDQALDALSRAVRCGLSRVETLRTAEALNSLHGRTEFQLLLLDAVFPAKPFAP